MRKAETLPPCADCHEIWEPDLLETSGPVQACNGIALPLPFLYQTPTGVVEDQCKRGDGDLPHPAPKSKQKSNLSFPLYILVAFWLCACDGSLLPYVGNVRDLACL